VLKHEPLIISFVTSSFEMACYRCKMNAKYSICASTTILSAKTQPAYKKSSFELNSNLIHHRKISDGFKLFNRNNYLL